MKNKHDIMMELFNQVFGVDDENGNHSDSASADFEPDSAQDFNDFMNSVLGLKEERKCEELVSTPFPMKYDTHHVYCWVVESAIALRDIKRKYITDPMKHVIIDNNVTLGKFIEINVDCTCPWRFRRYADQVHINDDYPLYLKRLLEHCDQNLQFPMYHSIIRLGDRIVYFKDDAIHYDVIVGKISPNELRLRTDIQ